MTLKTQKIISAALIAFVVIGGFEALIYLVNLDQPVVYMQVAFWIFLYLLFKIVFLFDLHFKKRGAWSRAREKHQNITARFERTLKTLGTALAERFAHLKSWKAVRQWLHFLLLPGFIFWATVSLFYVNLGNIKVQELVALLSAAAIILDFWFLKEAFQRDKEIVDTDIFICLSMVKIYAAAALYAAAMSILRYYCLDPRYYALEVFGYTFLLIYQALYLHKMVNGKNTAITLLISAVMSLAGYYVYVAWAYNYFTASIFLASLYNLMWSIFHYKLDKALNWQRFWEIFLVSAIIVGMVFSVTNFRARILDDCEYFRSF